MKNDEFNFLEKFLTEPLWDREQAATMLNCSPDSLAVWDSTKRYDLKPIKVGENVRYCPVYLRYYYAKKHLKPKSN